MSDFTMTRGDNRTIEVAVTSDGAAVNLTGASLTFTARMDYSAPVLVTKSSATASEITVTNAAGGLAEVYLIPADTSALPHATVYPVYDVQLTQAAGTVTTVVRGKITVNPDVTR